MNADACSCRQCNQSEKRTGADTRSSAEAWESEDDEAEDAWGAEDDEAEEAWESEDHEVEEAWDAEDDEEAEESWESWEAEDDEAAYAWGDDDEAVDEHDAMLHFPPFRWPFPGPEKSPKFKQWWCSRDGRFYGFSRADIEFTLRAHVKANSWANEVRRQMIDRMALGRKMRWKWRKKRWKNFDCLATYFGSGWVTRGRISRIVRRIGRICALLQERQIAYYRIPNDTGDCRGLCKSANAYNLPLGRRAVYLCPEFYTRTLEQGARTIVHELAHEIGIYGHRKLDGEAPNPDRKNDAKELAAEKPLRAGKSPANFAWFFSDVGLKRTC